MVQEIRDGAVARPEIIEAVGKAPEQYPFYDEEEWQVVISDQTQVGNILASIEDELIRAEHAALTGAREARQKEPADTLRREMEWLLLKNPDRMLMFMTAEMRKLLSELLRTAWIDSNEKCTLAQLYSFGFGDFPKED